MQVEDGVDSMSSTDINDTVEVFESRFFEDSGVQVI